MRIVVRTGAYANACLADDTMRVSMQDTTGSLRFTMIVCPYPLFVKDGRVLLTRRKHTGYMPGYYSLPAGHEEKDERLLACLAREAGEETGLTFDPSDAELVHVMHRKEEDVRMDLFFLIRSWHGELEIREPEKCDHMDWFPFDSLPERTVPYIRAAIAYWRHGVVYAETGWHPS